MEHGWRNKMFSGAAGLGMGAAGLGAGLFGGNNAFNDYQQYMGQGMGQIGQYLNQAESYQQPYLNAGQFGIGGYEGMLGRMGNPNYVNSIQQNYQMSPGAKFQMTNGMAAVKNAMANQGLGGSGPEGKALTNYTQGVINQDMNNYVDQTMSAQRAALGGYGDLSHLGLYGAQNAGQYAMDAGQDLASMYSAEAQAAASQDNSNSNNMWGGIGAGIGALAKHFGF